MVKKELENLNEYDRYVIRKAIRYVFEEAQPELTEPLVKQIVDYAFGKEFQRNTIEELLDIMYDLTGYDLNIIRMMNKYICEQSSNEGNVEIMWDKFAEMFKLENDPTKGISENQDTARVIRILYRLQNIGLITINIPTMVGKINQGYIQSFSPTFFLKILLKYIQD